MDSPGDRGPFGEKTQLKSEKFEEDEEDMV